MSQVFSYVIFLNPDPEERITPPEILAEGTLIAKNMDKARMQATHMIPQEYIEEIDDIEVLVRSF